MPFAYRDTIVSGTRAGVEGTSQGINEIVDLMVNNMGWSLTDDRRNQAGNASEALTHKVVLSNGQGESGDQSNWYLTLASGSAAVVNQDTINMKIHSAYDTGTHLVPGSGVETPTTLVTHSISTDSDGNYRLWISGDKDGIAVVSVARDAYAIALAGRSQTFLDSSLEPFGCYLFSVAETAIATTAVKSLAGNPVQAFTGNGEGEFLIYGYSATNDPRMGLGNEEAFFSALPIVHTVDDASPLRKGAIGLVSNAWACAPATAGWLKGTVIVVSGTPNKEYIAFPSPSTAGIVLRKS
jgi:hypothetical protein